MNLAFHGTDPLDGRHDFDFILGGWKVRNRKRRDMTRLQGEDWIEFDTMALAQPILGGLSHVDRIWSDEGSADGQWERFTLRQFDPADRVWRIWWASTRVPGRLGPPLTGRFAGGVGTFTGDHTIAGRPASVCFEWVNLAPGRARWSRAFWMDAGRGWQVNWIMEFTRISRRKASDHRR